MRTGLGTDWGQIFSDALQAGEEIFGGSSSSTGGSISQPGVGYGPGQIPPGTQIHPPKLSTAIVSSVLAQMNATEQTTLVRVLDSSGPANQRQYGWNGTFAQLQQNPDLLAFMMSGGTDGALGGDQESAMWAYWYYLVYRYAGIAADNPTYTTTPTPPAVDYGQGMPANTQPVTGGSVWDWLGAEAKKAAAVVAGLVTADAYGAMTPQQRAEIDAYALRVRGTTAAPSALSLLEQHPVVAAGGLALIVYLLVRK